MGKLPTHYDTLHRLHTEHVELQEVLEAKSTVKNLRGRFLAGLAVRWHEFKIGHLEQAVQDKVWLPRVAPPNGGVTGRDEGSDSPFKPSKLI
jgi:hypothetical protein